MVLNDYAKAIVGGLIGFLGALQVASLSGGINLNEWIWVIITALTSSGLVALVPNTGTYAWVDIQDKNTRIAAMRRLAKVDTDKK